MRIALPSANFEYKYFAMLQSSSPPVLQSSSPPVTGRSHGLAVAPGHGQVALGTNKVALSGTGPQAGAWCGGPAPLYLPPPPLGHGLAPPPGTPSNWKRPINGNVITLDVRKRWGGVGWVGFFVFGSCLSRGSVRNTNPKPLP